MFRFIVFLGFLVNWCLTAAALALDRPEMVLWHGLVSAFTYVAWRRVSELPPEGETEEPWRR